MIFNIAMTLQDKKGQQLMPFNYHYPLSTVIHSIIRKSDAKFASFFHDVGYGHGNYKLFTFSDIIIPFTSKGDRMLLLDKSGSFKVCFHVPQAAEHFIKGLFINENLIVSDQISQVSFRIVAVENCPLSITAAPEDIISVMVQPISPLVVGGDRGGIKGATYRFFSPYEMLFSERLIFSWLQKYKAISQDSDIQVENLRHHIKVEMAFFPNPPTERRIVIKDGRDNAQKVRGYTKFRMKITAPQKLIELALNSGLGIKNSVGMGCIQLINQI